MNKIESNKSGIAMKGRPTSPEAIEKVTKNLKVQSSHGVFFWLRKGIPTPNCSQCIFSSECEYYKKEKQCKVTLEIYDEIFSEILKLGHINYTDQLLVANFVKNYCALVMIDKWVAHIGPFSVGKDGLKAQSILEYRANLERLILRFSDALGIGPQARARLNLNNVQSFCFAEALLKAKPISNETAKIIIPKKDDDDNE
jgi:hypothetical protein